MRPVPAASPRSSWLSRTAALAAAALLVAGLAVASPQQPAAADTAPTDAGIPATVAADALPTVQIDGVAWSQVIVAGTVYVAGSFTTARPAGAAPGTATVARANLLAYDLASGSLITTWAPALNGPAYVISASVDGTRLYVGGDFTTVNGAAQSRFVVLNRATGQRVAGFNPQPNAAVRAIAATSSTIYFGGNFTAAAGNTRNRLAAVSATTGALLAWTISAQSAQVEAMVLSPDNTRLILGGRFTTLGGVTARGSGAVSTSTAALLRWDANQVVQNYGYDGGVTGLSSDGTWIYGTAFVYQGRAGTGNLEGAFAANPTTGAIRWIEDCHGDTYSVFANPGGNAIYTVGHAYFCGNLNGYPEQSAAQGYRFAQAFSTQDVMTITPAILPVAHPAGFDWQGFRAPALLDYFPDFTPGTASGQNQATWHVTGTADYVVYAGEFRTVNGQGQQGLARMAVSTRSTNRQGPQLTGTALQPVATSKAVGSVQLSWPTTWDRDNETLTYRVLRDGAATPVYETTAQSTFWQLPRLSFTQDGLTPGRAYRYAVVASDPAGNSVTSPVVTVIAAGTGGVLGAYARGVLLDSPAGYWRLGEASGPAQDWTGFADSAVGADVTRAVAGALGADDDGSVRFTGTPTSRVISAAATDASNTFSVEAWFRTTSTAGGTIVGFGDSPTGDSVLYDRDVLLGTDGRLTFGVNPQSIRTITTPARYNDGAWHHVVASLSSAGMRLYVDGSLRAQRADTVTARSSGAGRQGLVFRGYWHVGGDSAAIWPGAGAAGFTGDIDEVAVYGRALTATEVSAHHAAGSGAAPVNQLASDAFGRTVGAGWGSADLGGAWTTTAGATSVSGGAGVLALATSGSSASARLPGVSGPSLSTRATVSWDRRPAGSGGWFLMRGRIAAGGEYRLKVGYKANGTVTARVVRTTAAGPETAVTAERAVPGLTYGAGTALVARFDVSGESPTSLRAKVWAASAAEPAPWFVDATDATVGLQVSGATGVAALLSSTATNAPVTVRVDDVAVTGLG